MADKKKNQITSENKVNIYKILCIILMLVLIVVLGKIGLDKWAEYKSAKVYDDLQEQVNQGNSDDETPAPEVPIVADTDTETTEEETLTVSIPQKNLEWNTLKKTNQDIYAWIYIPGTKVDYPVLQSSTDDTQYLNYNIDGSRGYPGCIYTEMVNSKDFTDFNTVIYGHNMKDGSMFRTLHDYTDKDFFENNRYIYIYTQGKTFVYEIYAAYTSDDAHIIYSNDFSDEQIRTRYLERTANMADANGNYKADIDVGKGSHIITLSTCTNYSNERYLVQAVLLGSE